MSWNHRVYKRRWRRNGSSETVYSIREVFYDNKGAANGYTAEDVAAVGSTKKELREELKRMYFATYGPVFVYSKERRKK